MGFNDRHYFRDDWSPRRYGPSRGGIGSWEVWKLIIAANICVFLLQIFITRPATVEDLERLPYLDPTAFVDYDGESYDGDETGEVESDNHSRQANETPSEGSANENVAEGEDPEPEEEPTDSESEKAIAELKEYHRREQALRESRRQMLEYMPRMSVVQDWFELDTEKVKHGQVWRLITAGFCHDRTGIFHLLFNMLFLFWFGQRLERVFGRAEFTAFYFAALLLSSLAFVALDLYTGQNIPAIGASGAVWGVVALYALMYPYERIYIYFLFPIEIRWLVLLYFIFDLHPVLLALSGDTPFTGVAHAAHIGGAIFGFCYWHQGWRLMPLLDQWKRDLTFGKVRFGNRNEPARVVKMSPESEQSTEETAADERLDTILNKISTEGRDALSDEELEYLEEASRKMRQQRR